MKLDTTSYYPEPLLPPDGEEDKVAASQEPPEVKAVVPETSASVSVDRIARGLSWVFVPMLMPIYGMMLVFALSILTFTPWITKVSFTLVVAAINVLLPVLLILVLKKMGIVKDVGLNERKERLIPYIVVAACFGATAYFLYYKHAPMWLVSFFTGGMAAAIFNLIVNTWWKISAHAAGIAGIVALLMRVWSEGYPQGNVTIWLVFVIIMAGLLGSARIWLGRHTVCQVLAGYAVGFLCVFFL